MTTSLSLDRLRGELPRCAGIAWFEGTPLELVAASGAPADGAWPGWNVVGKTAAALLRDGPLASPEVLLRWPTAMLLLVERSTGVVAIVMAATQANVGMALVEARMVASRVGA